MSTEIIEALVALAAVIGVILLIRRASARQIEQGGAGVKRRLREALDDGEATTAEASEDERKERRREERKRELAERRARRQAEGEERRQRAAEATEAAEGEEEGEEEEEQETGDRRQETGDRRPGKKGKKGKEGKGREEAVEEEEEEEEEEVEEAPAEKAVELAAGLARTRGGFVARLGRLFAKKSIDADVLEELEQVLFTADIGPKTAEKLFQVIKKELSRDQLGDAETIWSKIREESATILAVDSPPVDFSAQQPFLLLVLGVNGVGKTTTIGKLAAKLTRQGKKVLLAAGDTFRAAAVEQLDIWAKRAGADIVKGKAQADPASVIYEAAKRGAEEGYDVVIADTAGRLHTKVDLMEELKKVRRVCDKAIPGAPHETWMVLDATTGQNAIQQAQLFKQAMDITGIVLTKLDGTAKGGVILGIADELAVPVRYIGIGEKIDDLREFEPLAFVDALYAEAEAA